MRRLLVASLALLLASSLVRAAPPDDVRLDVLVRSPALRDLASLIQARNGLFYGTTWSGVLFRMTPSGAMTVLHRFGPDYVSLVEGTDGNLYGTTPTGGRSNLGTVFRMTPAGEVTTLHEFSGPDGSYPAAALVQARNGVFYGTTAGPGSDSGSVFWITSEGLFATLAALPEQTVEPVIQSTDGTFIVPTLRSIFRVALDGTTTLVRSGLFSPTMVQAADGNFYGTDSDGFFRLMPDGTYTVLNSSVGRFADLYNLPLIQASDGNFYVPRDRDIIRVTTLGTVSVVHTFTDAEAVFTVYARPVQAFDGSLYGLGADTLGPADAPVEGVIYRLSGLTAPVVTPPSVRGDLDGNGTADLVLRQQQTGDLWLLTTATGTARPAWANYVPGVPLAWRVAAIADVDGDGKSDLIWHDDVTGDVSVWLMNGGQILRTQLVAFGVPLAWRLVGAADLDGDHKADLIWRNGETGDVVLWFLDGVVILRGPVVASSVPLAWEIADVADVDGDGKADVIWRHGGTGDVAVWLMDAETVKQSTVVASGVPLAWQIAGVGDVDGDSKADLVWRHAQTGDVAIWLLDGAHVRESAVIATGLPLTFQVAKVADVDGDGRADLIWGHVATFYGSGTPTLDVSAWLMNGVSVTQGVFMLSAVPLEWHIQ
jgi:uncharacterized repeat protein (TIGR03803 family)